MLLWCMSLPTLFHPFPIFATLHFKTKTCLTGFSAKKLRFFFFWLLNQKHFSSGAFLSSISSWHRSKLLLLLLQSRAIPEMDANEEPTVSSGYLEVEGKNIISSCPWNKVKWWDIVEPHIDGKFTKITNFIM